MVDVKNLEHVVGGVAHGLCAIKRQGNPDVLVDFLIEGGVMKKRPADARKFFDDLWHCEMWFNNECVLMLSKYDG